MLILCVPEEVSGTEEIPLLLQKIPDNTNLTGLKFKYICALQVIAVSIHHIDRERSWTSKGRTQAIILGMFSSSY